jgi:hypothetical protein
LRLAFFFQRGITKCYNLVDNQTFFPPWSRDVVNDGLTTVGTIIAIIHAKEYMVVPAFWVILATPVVMSNHAAILRVRQQQQQAIPAASEPTNKSHVIPVFVNQTTLLYVDIFTTTGRQLLAIYHAKNQHCFAPSEAWILYGTKILCHDQLLWQLSISPGANLLVKYGLRGGMDDPKNDGPLHTLHREMRVAEYSKGNNGQYRRVTPKHVAKAKTQKPKLLERKDYETAEPNLEQPAQDT